MAKNNKQQQLEEIFGQDLGGFKSASEIGQELSPSIFGTMPRQEYLDMNKVERESEEQAAEMIEGYARFFLDEESINTPMIHAKIKEDILSLKSALLYMKMNEHASKRALENYELGLQIDHNFMGAMTRLHDSGINIQKHYKQVSLVIENSYRTIKIDIERLGADRHDRNNFFTATTSPRLIDDKMRSRGQKAILQNLFNNKGEEKSEETENNKE